LLLFFNNIILEHTSTFYWNIELTYNSVRFYL